MQRFRLMNVYVASLLLVVIAAIATVTLLRPISATAASPEVDSPPATVSAAAKPAAEEASVSARSSKQLTVAIDNFNFSPKELSVSLGDTVTWINHDDVPHTATSNDDPAAFDSKALDTDDKYSFTFTKPGTYGYYCKVHTHMTGKIIVK